MSMSKLVHTIFNRTDQYQWKHTTHDPSGLCFTVSYDRLENLLRGHSMKDVFGHQLNDKEYIRTVVAHNTGIDVYIGVRE